MEREPKIPLREASEEPLKAEAASWTLAFDMQREIWTSDRFRDLAGILFGAVVVVKGVDDANGAFVNSENTSCVCGWKLLMEIGYAGASRTDATVLYQVLGSRTKASRSMVIISI